MLDLAKVECAEFAAYLNQDFEIATSGAPLVLRLSEARPLAPRPESVREPFALTFLSAPQLRLPQGIYRMTNAQMGVLEVFLVQIAADQTSSTFEAVFN
ncbi:MAG TPA: hypothetical protein VK581_13590 [Chthoniobacterales bacterium]|nr:hypothetical protein [Chthoniobacterales bacterium]